MRAAAAATAAGWPDQHGAAHFADVFAVPPCGRNCPDARVACSRARAQLPPTHVCVCVCVCVCLCVGVLTHCLNRSDVASSFDEVASQRVCFRRLVCVCVCVCVLSLIHI